MELRESAADTLGMPEDQFVHELRKGIAVVLYAQERLPLSEAARLAGMAYADFMEYVTSPGLGIPYEEQEWKQDEQSLRKLGLLWLWAAVEDLVAAGFSLDPEVLRAARVVAGWF